MTGIWCVQQLHPSLHVTHSTRVQMKLLIAVLTNLLLVAPWAGATAFDTQSIVTPAGECRVEMQTNPDGTITIAIYAPNGAEFASTMKEKSRGGGIIGIGIKMRPRCAAVGELENIRTQLLEKFNSATETERRVIRDALVEVNKKIQSSKGDSLPANYYPTEAVQEG